MSSIEVTDKLWDLAHLSLDVLHHEGNPKISFAFERGRPETTQTWYVGELIDERVLGALTKEASDIYRAARLRPAVSNADVPLPSRVLRPLNPKDLRR